VCCHLAYGEWAAVGSCLGAILDDAVVNGERGVEAGEEENEEEEEEDEEEEEEEEGREEE
jgi:hypothetical protein